MSEEIWARLRRFLSSSLGLESDASGLNLDSRLREDLGLSSLKTVDLVIKLEDEFGINITDDELTTLVTLRDVVDLIGAKTVARQGAGG